MRSSADSDVAEQVSPLSVIIGPTAAGKSAVAMQLARARNLAIVSADSRQVYRGFDIGTAKPTAANRRAVPHFGIDVVDPEVRYSAHEWSVDAANWIRHSIAAGAPPLIVGGTGFYVRAIVRPLASVPDLDSSRRNSLERWLSQLDFHALGEWCRRLDPSRADLGRTQRIRAVETVLLSGRRLSESFVPRSHVRAVRYLVVDPGERLPNRIENRVRDMFDAGWVEEVRSLIDRVPRQAPAWLASGYAAVREHVEGRVSLATAMERVVIETRQYAKRQRTWCRHQLTEGAVTRIDPDAPDAGDRIAKWWDALPDAS